ncbi:MAG TPA: hypothetical protein VIL77_08265 [Gaiellaceae bacterium]
MGVTTAFHNPGLRAEQRWASIPGPRGEGTWRYTFTVTDATHQLRLTRKEKLDGETLATLLAS